MSAIPCTLAFLSLSFVAGASQDVVDSYEEVDAALRGEFLLPLGATWRYKVGTEEPVGEPASEKDPHLDWTKLEFWDADWKEGASPLGYNAEGLATVIEGMEGVATTVYMRHILDVYDPAVYDELEFLCPVDDGYVMFLNGTEEDRQHAGIYIHVKNTDKASSDREINRLPVPEDELNGVLVAGPNPVAIIGLVHPDDTGSFEIRPQIYGTFRKNEEEDGLRVKLLRKRLGGDAAEALDAYCEGVLHERAGRYDEALEQFAKAALADPEAFRPWQRQVECARAAGTAAPLAERLEQWIREGLSSVALLDTWTELVLDDLGESPARLASIARDGLPTEGRFADSLWAAERLLAAEPLRIDCGAAQDRGSNGTTWSRDRLFTYGQAQTPDEADAAKTVRAAARAMGDYQPLYRVPVLPGHYELRLSFDLAPDNTIDVLVDGARAIRTQRGGDGVQTVSLPVRARGNRIDVDLVARTRATATLAGLEIWPVDAKAFATLAERWRAERGDKEVYALVQSAEAHLSADRPMEALAAFEKAEALPGFGIDHAARLGELRDSLLPNLFSFASANDVASRRREDADRIAEAAKKAATNDREKAVATFLEGRLAQLEGRLDDATILFEELAFDGEHDTEPYLRMAECLKAASLGPEAEDILRAALDAGATITPAFLRLWVGLALDDLERDPWDVVTDLAQFEIELPEWSVVSPTSEETAQLWEYLPRQPPTVKWSQTSFSALDWYQGLGGIGWGTTQDTNVRTPWEGAVMYARRPLTLPGDRLLYPHARVAMSDAGDVYLNGTIAHRLRGRTSGYDVVPMRGASFQDGLNYFGFYAFNIWDQSIGDVGVVEPLGLLVWIQKSLEEDAVRINCGGGELVDSAGRTWHADRFFAHGTPSRVEESAESPRIQGTEDDELYRSQCAFSVRHEKASFYNVPLPDGAYEVTLHFAEPDPRFQEPGKRQFTVKLEDEKVLEAFDTSAELGFATAGSRTFETGVTDGWLDLDFVHVKDKAFPSVSALEIRRAK